MTDNPDHDHDPADQPGPLVPRAPAFGALTSLAELATTLNQIDTASVGGRSGKPMLQFKSRENVWVYGQQRTQVEEDSRWAINPTSWRRGPICFAPGGNKVLGERTVPAHMAEPDITQLPDLGQPWVVEWTVELRCCDGIDAGLEVVFKTTTDGGIKALVAVVDEVRNRLNGGQHGGLIVPIMKLTSDSYPHPQYGRIWFPVFLPIVEWMGMDGPVPPHSPAPQSAGAAVEQPRRRRVG
jgi:hypothetical protein